MDGEQIVRDAADKIRALVTDAEERAAQIVREAEADAERIRERARAEAEERLAAARAAFDELHEKLGLTGEKPTAEVPGGPVPVPEPSPPDVPEPTPPPPDPSPSPEPVPEPEPPLVPEPEPPPDEGTPPQSAEGAANGAKSGDAAAARLVAMNMALDGASREAIEAHLAENYELPNAGAIVDDVLQLARK